LQPIVSVTLYQQIAQDLVGKVRSGELPPGSQLPTEMQLMEAYGASRNTVRSALSQLQDMGMISRRRNRGTRVEGPPAAGAFTQSMSTLDDLVSLARTAQRKVESAREEVLDVKRARELGCAPGSRWLHIAMTRHASGAAVPLGWTDAYVDPHYKELRRLASRHPDALLAEYAAWVEERTGRRLLHGEIVSLGVLIMAHLQENAPEAAAATVRAAGVAVQPAAIGTCWAEVEAAVLALPEYARDVVPWYTVVDALVEGDPARTRLRRRFREAQAFVAALA